MIAAMLVLDIVPEFDLDIIPLDTTPFSDHHDHHLIKRYIMKEDLIGKL